MTENNPYKTTRMGDIENHQDNSHYTAIPTEFSSSRPQSGVYDSLTTPTPSHKVKQSDNPLYSSTQELRISAAYDIPSRARSLTPSAFEIPPVLPNTDFTNNYAKASGHTTSTGNSNRLSYGLELELSNREIPPVRHHRSLSQTAEPVYTEL